MNNMKKMVGPLIAASAAVALVAVASAAVVKKKGQKAEQEGWRRWLHRCRSARAKGLVVVPRNLRHRLL